MGTVFFSFYFINSCSVLTFKIKMKSIFSKTLLFQNRFSFFSLSLPINIERSKRYCSTENWNEIVAKLCAFIITVSYWYLLNRNNNIELEIAFTRARWKKTVKLTLLLPTERNSHVYRIRNARDKGNCETVVFCRTKLSNLEKTKIGCRN